jgi:hypothetical protein
MLRDVKVVYFNHMGGMKKTEIALEEKVQGESALYLVLRPQE